MNDERYSGLVNNPELQSAVGKLVGGITAEAYFGAKEDIRKSEADEWERAKRKQELLKEETIANYDKLVQEKNSASTVREFYDLEKKFLLMDNYRNSAALAEECGYKWDELRRSTRRRDKMLRLLQLGVVAVFLYVIFGTGFLYSLYREVEAASSIPERLIIFLQMSAPLILFSLVIGIINLFRFYSEVSSIYIAGMIIAQTIALTMLSYDGRGIGGIVTMILLYLVGSIIVSIPAFIVNAKGYRQS